MYPHMIGSELKQDILLFSHKTEQISRTIRQPTWSIEGVGVKVVNVILPPFLSYGAFGWCEQEVR